MYTQTLLRAQVKHVSFVHATPGRFSFSSFLLNVFAMSAETCLFFLSFFFWLVFFFSILLSSYNNAVTQQNINIKY